MKIWVDADACPRAVKDILYRAAERNCLSLVLVANQGLSVPNSAYIKSVQVNQGFDEADNYIVDASSAGDIAITQDIPLAADLVAKQLFVISPRGEQFTADNIKQRLAMRNYMETLRDNGVDTGGPAQFSNTDKQQFANRLDRLIAKLQKT